ncbi:MAG: sporulation protein YabP [Oscillospiraceae bacterium]|nr:sporulation protein YabP [Oscillospiraceae bacterium]
MLEPKKKTPSLPHGLTLDDRSVLRITGVTDLDCFDEREIVLYTSAGELTVRGRELHVREVDLEAGALHVEGDIWSLWYGDRDKRSPLGLLGRLLR